MLAALRPKQRGHHDNDSRAVEVDHNFRALVHSLHPPTQRSRRTAMTSKSPEPDSRRRPLSAAKSPIGRSRNRTFSTTLARRLRSHWRALLTLHAFAVPKAWRSFQNQTLAEVAGTSTDQCKSLPVV